MGTWCVMLWGVRGHWDTDWPQVSVWTMTYKAVVPADCLCINWKGREWGGAWTVTRSTIMSLRKMHCVDTCVAAGCVALALCVGVPVHSCSSAVHHGLVNITVCLVKRSSEAEYSTVICGPVSFVYCHGREISGSSPTLSLHWRPWKLHYLASCLIRNRVLQQRSRATQNNEWKTPLAVLKLQAIIHGLTLLLKVWSFSV